MTEYTPGSPEWHARNMAYTERIVLTDDEIELLAADIEEAACIMDEEYPTLAQVCKELYRSIGQGNLKSYVATLKVQEAAKLTTAKVRGQP